MTVHGDDTGEGAIRGRIVRPGEPDWDDARRAWNLAVDQHPAMVVVARDSADIEAAVRYARAAGLAVSAQPRGHGAVAGRVDGTLLVRTSALRELRIDTAYRTARVGAGVTWGELLAALDGTGLVALAGSNPDVTVVGYTLGGGLSWFSRKYGLATRAVRAIDLVDAQGRPVRVTDSSDPDLFWALRGGGGEFGIVTAIEIDLYPERSIIGGKITFPAAQAAAVFTAFAELTAVAPRELTLWAGLMHFPDAPALPEHLRGQSFVTVDVTHLGTEQECEVLLWTLRAAGTPVRDTVAPISIGGLGAVAEEPVDPMPGVEYALLLHRFDDRTVRRLLAAAGPGTGTPLLGVTVRHLGGALADLPGMAAGYDRVRSGVTAYLREPYLVHALGIPASAEHSDGLREAFEDLAGAMGSDAADHVPFNFLGDRDLADAYGPQELNRLRAVKRERDPQGVLRGHRAVLPA